MLALAATSGPVQAQDAVCAKVKLVIPQKLTFERDAFDAMLTLTNNLTDAALDDLSVQVEIRTMAGQIAEEEFFVTVSSLDNVTGVDGAGLILPNEMGTVHWLLIPSAGAGGTLPGGVNYHVKATITYSVNGQPFDLETYEETITVKPQPLLVLDYFLPQRVWGDDPFTAEAEAIVPYELAVRVSNVGWGPANTLQIESAQPVIVENDKGLLIDFKIIGTWLDGTSIGKSLTLLFGNLMPKTCSTGAWAMTSSLQGTFTELAVTFSHKDELGGEKTSLVEGANSHWLVRMVQLDTPGKDAEPDLLAYEIGEPEGIPTVIYESDCGTSPVSVVPAVSAGSPSLIDNTASVTATLQAGWCWMRATDPAAGAYPILKVVRDSDGKVLNARNAWIQLDEDRLPYVAILDWSTLGPLEETYTIFYDLSEFDETPPVSELTFVGPYAGASPIVVSPFTIINMVATDDMAGVATRELRKDGGEWLAAAPFFFQSGEHLLEYRATDKKGNVEATRVAQIVVDSAAPVVTAVSPLKGATHHLHEPLLVDVDVDDLDPTPAVALTLVFKDSGAALEVPAPGTLVDISGLLPGEYDLLAQATDWMGNEQTTVIGPFTLDEFVGEPPVVTLSGVVAGSHVASPVAVVATVEPAEVPLVVTLDGQPYAPGTLVAADGVHVIEAIATDAWGQQGEATLTFTLDQTAPVVAWAGVTAGQVAGAPVTPTLTVLEPNLLSQVVTLDGAAFTSGAVVASEGPHTVSAVVSDQAGNETTASVAFTVDLSAPSITISGVEDGGAYAVVVTPTVEITDLTLVTSTSTLDGEPYVSGSPIDAEGTHTLVATAEDAVGRTAEAAVTFLVDLTAPSITVTGVDDGGAYAAAVIPEISIEDAHLTESLVTLDGAPFTSGTEVTEPGEHTLLVSAADAAGNTTEVSVVFTIDMDAPLIVVEGVASGAFYAGPVTPVVTVTDTDLDTVTTTLDDAPFTSGDTVATEGSHLLRVTATDTAGNQSVKPVAFTIDTIAPVVAVSGIEEGAVYGAPVVPAVVVTDATAVVVERTLDDAPHTSGTAVAAEGPHVYAVTATDKAGNQASATVSFTVDLTGPSVVLAGVDEGAWVASPVAVTVDVQDATPTTLVVLLDGAPYEPGTEVAVEGSHEVVATATDAAGNESVASRSFGVDMTAPVVTLTGVTDGGLYGSPVSVGWSVDEAHPASTVATLDGSPVTNGQEVASEGPHTLTVTVTDLAGSTGSATATFTLDLSAPEITLAGVTEGDVVQGPVVVTVEVDDPAATVTATLDGHAWEPGTPVSDEGDHTIAVSVTDAAGNEGQATVTFTVDATAPVIALAGVSDGGIYGAPIAPTFTVTDATDLVTVALVDGEPFASGDTVAIEGPHVLLVQATDAAGNAASVEVSFIVDLSAPLVTIAGVTDGAWYAAPVTPTVETDAGDPLIEATLDGAAWEPGTEVTPEGLHTLAVTVTDSAGNAAKTTVTFGIDMTAPEILVTGISDGAVVPAAAPVVSATDEHLTATVVTLDDEPFVSGADVTAAGAHTLVVSATDIAGNESVVTISFFVDPAAPLLTLLGVEDGGVYGAPVTVDIAIEALSEVTLSATLDGEPFEPGSVVATEGPHTIEATATNQAGATGVTAASFALDFTAPVVTIEGVTDGGFYGPGVAPTWTASDAWPGTVVATLDGEPLASGNPVLTDGVHVLHVEATDQAGNVGEAEVQFVVDDAPPTVSLLGVADGAVVQGPVAVTVELSPGATVAVTLDDAAYEPGTPISAEGPHTVVAEATSPAGHTALATLAFVIDTTPPVITVTGVEDGGLYATAVTPVVEVQDTSETVVSITVDGAAAESGAPVSGKGAHELVVQATDAAGNITITQVNFTIDPSAPVVALLGVADGAHYGAAVTVDVSAEGAASVSLTVDGEPAAVGAVVDTEGEHVAEATAVSAAGVGATASASFVLDFTAPVVAIAGVADGGIYTPGVAPTWTTSDAWLASVVATLDGAATVSGDPVMTDGPHVLRVEATDLAGNLGAVEVRFVVDGAPPTVSLLGVDDGAVVQGPVAVTVELSPGATVVVTLDDTPYEPGTSITADGPHAVVAVATSQAGVTAEAAVAFTIDTTAPVIQVSGVEDGATYPAPVSPAVVVEDAHPGAVVSTLDGSPFVSGTSVTEPGVHALHVEATDLAGNEALSDTTFTIEEPPPGPLVVRVTRGGAPVTGARVVLLDGDGAWLGLQGLLDASGTWTVEPPAEGTVRVRVDRLWRRYLSETVTWPADSELVVELLDEPAWSHTLHVRSDAPTSGDGSSAKPLRTVGEAIAAASFDTLIRVAGGVYAESITIPDGVAVEGSYDPENWTLSPELMPTVLEGAGDEPVVRFDGSFHGELAHVTVRGGGGVALTDASPLVRSVIIEECSRPLGACLDQTGGDLATLVNVAVTGNAAPAAVRISGAPTHLWNVTIADNSGAGLALFDAAVLVERAIIARNGGTAVEATGASGAARLDHCLVWGNGSGVPGGIETPSLIDADPAFVSGPLHDHYLSQLAAGDGLDSPALDAGGVTAEAFELATLTTAVSGAADEGEADLGFHAWPMAPLVPGDDVGGADAGADAGGEPDATGEPDAGSTDTAEGPDALDAAGGSDATGGDTADAASAEGCGSCRQSPGSPQIPAGGAALLALVLTGLFTLRRRPRRAYEEN